MNTEANDDGSGLLLDGVQGIANYFLPATTEEERRKNARTVQHWIDSHGLPVARVGRRIYGRVKTVKAWLDQQEGKALARGHEAGGPSDD